MGVNSGFKGLMLLLKQWRFISGCYAV